MSLDYTRVRAALFDIDGTLRDTDDELVRTAERVLRRVAGADRASRWARPVVVAVEHRAQAVLGVADRLHIDGPINRLIDFLAPHGPTSIIADARETLAVLHGAVRIGVVSAGPTRQVERFLDQHALRPYIDVVVTSQTHRRMKPHPQPVLGALSALGVAPENAVMVGDTTVDVKAGQAAGTQTYGVLTGFGRRRDLQRHGADEIADSFAPLVAGILAGRTDRV